MAVYIDNYNAKFRRMIMCHMIADSTEELISMAKAVGVNPKWIQYAGTYNEHFDICLSMKAKALKLGAKEIPMMELGRMLAKRPGHPLKERLAGQPVKEITTKQQKLF